MHHTHRPLQHHVIRQRQPHQASILVCTTASAMGDTLMLLPFLEMLRIHFPAYHVTWLVDDDTPFLSYFSNLANRLLDAIVTEARIRTDAATVLRHCLHNPFKKASHPLSEGHTLIFCVDTHVKRNLVLKSIPHQHFITAAAKYRLSTLRPPSDHQRPQHTAQRHCDLIYIAKGCRIPTIDAQAVSIHLPLAPYTEAAQAALPPGPCYIGFAPGAGHPTRPKKWPLEKYIAVAQQQVTLQRVPVFFLGPSEQNWRQVIHEAIPTALFPEENMPSTADAGPLRVVALAKHLHAAVTNDNGTSHLMALAHTPLVALFGCSNPDKFAPPTPRAHILRSQSWSSDNVADIPIAAVLSGIEALLNHHPSSNTSTNTHPTHALTS